MKILTSEPTFLSKSIRNFKINYFKLFLSFFLITLACESLQAQTVTITGNPQQVSNISPGLRNRVLYLYKIEVTGSAATMTGINNITTSGNYLSSDINNGNGTNRGFNFQYLLNSSAASYLQSISNLDNYGNKGTTLLTIAGNSTGTGQTLNGTFGTALTLPVGIHWIYLTADIAIGATINRTVGISAHDQSVFTFSGSPTVTTANFSAAGLQTFKNATLALSAATPVDYLVERNINNVQLYRVDVTANGATTQIGDGNGTPALTFNLESSVPLSGIDNFGKFRVAYSVDNVLEPTDQYVGDAIETANIVNLPLLPITIPEGQTRSFFLTTHAQSTALEGATLRVSNVNANAPSGTTFVPGSGPADLPAGGLRTMGFRVANVSLTGFKTAETTILQGTKNNVLGGVEVNVTAAASAMTKLTLNVNGTFTTSDYTSLKLWASDVAVFDPSTALLLKTQANTILPNGTFVMDFPGIGPVSNTPKYYPFFVPGSKKYFFLTVDLSPTAAAGSALGMGYNNLNSTTTNTVIPGTPRTVVNTPNANPVIGANPQIAIVGQTNEAVNLPRGTSDQILNKQKITITNISTTLNAVAFNVSTTNFNDIDGGYKLYYTTSSTLNIATATQVGAAVPALANTQTLSFTPASPININTSTAGYLFLIANINASADLGNTVIINSPSEVDFSFAKGVKTVTQNAVTHTISNLPKITISASSLPVENIAVGTKNVLLYQLNMQASNAGADFSGITLKSAASGISNGDISAYRLFYSIDGTLNEDSDIQIGSAVPGAGNNQDIVFSTSVPQRIAIGTTSTLFLVADVAANANLGSVISIQPPVASNLNFILGEVIGNPAAGANKSIVAPPTVTVSSNTPASNLVAAGTTNVILYKSSFTTDATSYVNFLGVDFTSGNLFKPTDISGGYSLYLSNNATFNAATATLVATSPTANTPQLIKFTSTKPLKIAAGSTNYLFVISNISPYAAVGNTIKLDALALNNLYFESSNITGTTQDGESVVVTAATQTNFSYLTPPSKILECTPTTTVDTKVLDITKAPYNADPTGVQDATAAFRLAVSKSASFVYVPNGTYRLTDSVAWNPTPASNGRGGASIILWGESRNGVVLRLDNNAPGYGNIANPKSFINTGEDNPQRFNNSIHNVTIEIGSGNPGAIGVRHYCNNLGGMSNVTVRSADGNGLVGIDKAYSRANGPSFLKDILVDGFDIGIRTDYSVESEIMEHITLQNQKKFGFYNYKQVVTLRDLKVINCAGTALVNESGHITLLDSDLKGTGSAAISNGSKAKMLVRNLKTSGYTTAINDPESPEAKTTVDEWTSNPVVGRNGIGIGKTLNLPIKETPIVPWDAPANWVNVEDFGATDTHPTLNPCAGGAPIPCFVCDDDAPKVQAAIDATLPGGPRAGATTLFLPGNYRMHSQIRLRGSIRRVLGTGSGIGGPSSGIIFSDAGGIPNGTPLPSPLIIIEAGTSPEIVFENINLNGTGSTNACAGCLGLTTIDNSSGRTLILKNLAISSCTITGGELYIESVSGTRDGLFTFNNVNVWARQFNPERDATKIIVNGGSYWGLGLKTEGHGEIIVAKNNAKVELFGGFVYSLSDSRGEPMFDVDNADVSLNFFEYAGRYGRPYLEIVKDKQGANTSSLLRGADSPQYYAPQPPQVPANPATWSQRNDNTIADAPDLVVGTNLVLYVNKGSTNIAPSFVIPTQTLLVNNSVGQTFTVNNFATAITDNNNEVEQLLRFKLTTDNNLLFAKLPAIDSVSGKLTYAIKPNGIGTANITVVLIDNGSNVAPNQNTSTALNFAITATSDVVPITLTTFTGKKSTSTVVLNWETSSEFNNSHYSVLRSIDGINFTAIGRVPGYKNSRELKKYSFVDVNPLPGNNYYKLEQFDLDGSSDLYGPVVVNYKLDGLFKVYATKEKVVITVDVENSGAVEVTLVDVNGKRIAKKSFFATQGVNVFSLPVAIPPGVYVVTVEGAQINENEKVIVK